MIPTMATPGLILLFCLTVFTLPTMDTQKASSAPSLQFMEEPPGKVDFVNSRGATVACRASAGASVSWVLVDGTPATPVAGLRELESDGSLVFRPFGAERFRPDVHSAVYRCVATLSGSKIIRSRDVNVQGVVLQNHDIQVYDTYAMEGNSAIIKCHVPPVMATYLTVTAWIKNDNLLIEPTTEDAAANEKYAIMPSGELHIRDVTKADTGSKFKCKAVHRLTGESKLSSNSGQLLVTPSRGTVAPRILESDVSATIAQSKTAALGCIAQGNPIPRINWFTKSANGQMTPVNIRSGGRMVTTKTTLLIKNSRTSDTGIYVCEAANDLGKEQQEITLTVTEPLSVDIDPPTHMVKIGDRVQFKCAATGQPAPSIMWLHNGEPIKNINQTELSFESVQLSDSGMYQCVAKNGEDMVQAVAELLLSELSPQLVEVFEERVAQSNSDVSMKCVASGIPQPTIQWNLDDTEVKNSSNMVITSSVNKLGHTVSNLKIRKVKISEGGLYSCVAVNRPGTAQHFARINVPGALGGRPQQNKVGILGQNLMMSCPVYGYPINKVIWEKGARLLPVNIRQQVFKNGSLVIDRVSKLTDSGTYKCVASDIQGQKAEALLKVEIIIPPKIVPFEFQDELLREGMRARLQCVVSEGDLPLNVTWLKDGKPIPPELGIMVRVLDEFSSILTLSSITPAHNGKFTCVASNKAATLTHTAELSVNVAPKIVPFSFQGDHVFEGALARLTCVVYQGDLPLKITWEKDGGPIPPALDITVRSVDTYTSILTIDHVQLHHGGNYSCLAQNKAASASHTTPLVVNVPPKIIPFSFQEEHLVEGQLARVSCIVGRGDLPLHLHWEKDGLEISSNLEGVQIRSFDEHSSILSINQIDPKHNGLYTCIASNGAGTARHSAQLMVKVPPRWIEKPADAINVIRGQNVLLHCQADGFPKPQITWRQAKDTHDGVITKPLHSGNNINIFSNGSLLIEKISNVDEGFYYCLASNGIGEELSTKIDLKINAPPQFKEMTKNIDGKVGSDIQLQCLVQGDTPLNIKWFQGGKIVEDNQSRHKIQTTNTASDAVSFLTIHKLERSDSGVYVCSAENKFGNNKIAIELTVKGLPDSPTDLRAINTNSKSIELTWKAPFNGNDNIRKYIIQYKEATNLWEDATTTETVNGEPSNSIIGNLLPSTSYLFRIHAENEQGHGPNSQILRVTTSDDVPSGPPTNVEVESVNTETIKIMWKAPEEKFWNGKVQGFYVGYKEVDTEDPFLFKTLLTPDPKANDLYVQIGGLKQFTKYAVVVLAYNSQGKGPQSEPVVIMTSEGAPSLPPTDIRCTTLTSQQIHVTWEAPPSDSINGILRGYKVAYKPASDWFEELAENHNLTLQTSLTLNQLDKFSNYSVQVLATTRAGEGPRSNVIYCKTLDDVPSSPDAIKAIATSDDSVVVAWKQPEHPNGVISSYTIHWQQLDNKKESGSHTVPARESVYEITNLKKGKQYDFWVTAATMAGKGTPSRRINQSPNGPTVAAKVASFDEKIVTSLKSTVSLACKAVGLPEPQKNWMWNGKFLESNFRAKIAADGTLTISEIEEKEAGDYSCLVKNDFGEDKITYTLIVLAPPLAPAAEIMTTTSNSIDLQWNVPTSKMSRIKAIYNKNKNGGYTIHSRREGGDWEEKTVGPDVRTHHMNSLLCGTRYEIYMTAFNKIGISAPSEAVLISTKGSVPAAPAKTDLIEETTNTVSLFLNTWKSNGCPILYFIVEYAPRSSNEWTFVSNNIKPEQRRLVIPGLKAGTWYGLRMTAHNDAGSAVSEYSFATLTVTGATISPDLQSDSTNSQSVDGLLAYLNLYIIVPISCTVVILLAILGAACFYIKMRGHHGNNDEIRDNQMAAIEYDFRQNECERNYATIPRGTMSHERYANLKGQQYCDEPTPYATFQLNNQDQCMMATMNRRGIAPPLPPPRMQENQNSSDFNGIPVHPQFFENNGGNPFQDNVSETTFVFPIQLDNGQQQQGMPNYPFGYPNEDMRQGTN